MARAAVIFAVEHLPQAGAPEPFWRCALYGSCRRPARRRRRAVRRPSKQSRLRRRRRWSGGEKASLCTTLCQRHFYFAYFAPSLFCGLPQLTIHASCLPLGDKMRTLNQHCRRGAKRRERGFGFIDELAQACFGASNAEHARKCGLAGGAVLADGFAHECRIAFDVEQIVGDLKRFADGRAIARERFAL